MKRRLLLISLSVTAISLTPLQGLAEKVKFEQLPEAVQKSVRVHAGAAPIEDIDREIRNGRVTYEVAYKKNGQHTELLVLEDGSVVVGDAAQPPGAAAANEPKQLSDATKVELDEVPEQVRQTIQLHAGSSRIEDIDKGKLDGRTVYQAAFKQNGQHTELRVAENGEVLSPQQQIRPLTQTQLLQAQLGRLPVAVQQTVRKHATPDQITDVDQERLGGRRVYEIQFQRDGRSEQIFVGEDGALVKPVGQQIISRTPQRSGQDLQARPGQEVQMNQLPAPVQNTIRAYAGRAAIEDIDVLKSNGETVYQAAFKRNERHTELQVAQDGSVIGLFGEAVGTPATQPEVGRARARDEINLRSQELPVAGLPQPVQSAIQNRVRNGQISKIERESFSGQVYYEVEFERDGREHEIHIRQDGYVLDQR